MVEKIVGYLKIGLKSILESIRMFLKNMVLNPNRLFLLCVLKDLMPLVRHVL